MPYAYDSFNIRRALKPMTAFSCQSAVQKLSNIYGHKFEFSFLVVVNYPTGNITVYLQSIKLA